MQKQIETADGHIDKIYYCHHDPNGTNIKYSFDCDCRKPKPGMIFMAMKKHGIEDLAGSYIIGDKNNDIITGIFVNLKAILVKTGYAGTDRYAIPHHTADNLYDAAKIILGEK